MKLNFNTKDTYIAARKEWTAAYMDLSTDIRKARAGFIEAQRAASKSSFDPQTGTPEERKEHFAKWYAVDDGRRMRADLRTKANDMLSNLQAAKEEAHRQWLAVHAG